MLQFLNKHKTVLILGLSCLLVSLFLIRQYNPSFFPHDTAQYLSASSNFLQGKGFATSILYYEENYQLNQIPAYQTVFPPGYPALISFFVLLGLSPQLAAFSCTLLSYLVSTIVLFFILERIKGSSVVNLFLCGAWLLSTNCWLNILKSLSELPFICCTLLSFLFYSFTFKRHNKRYVWLFLAGVFAAASFLIRYAGIFYAASLILSNFAITKQQGLKQKIIDTVMAGSVPILVIALVLYKNFTLTGDAKGGNPEVSTTSVLDAVRTFYYSLSNLTGLSLGGLKDGNSPDLLFFFGCLICIFLFLKHTFSKKPSVNRIKEALQNPFISFPLLYTLVTVFSLGYLEKTTSVGLSDRMLLPLIPFLFISGKAGTPQLTKSKSLRIVACLFLVVFILTQKTIWNHGYIYLQEQSKNYYKMVQALDEQMTRHQSVRRFLEQSLPEQCPVFSNDPQQLGLLLKKPILGIPGAAYSTASWDSDMIHAVAIRYNVNYFIYFENLNNPQIEASKFWQGITTGKVPSWLTSFYSSERIKIYRKK